MANPKPLDAIQREEHMSSYGVKRVAVFGWDGEKMVQLKVGSLGQLNSDEERHTIAIEYDANNNPIYIGEVAEGTAKTVAAWRIKKLAWDASGNMTDLQWADGNDNFDNVWDDRVTYSYS